MAADPSARPPNRIRLTTGVLMVWIFALAVALGFLKGDVADWIPQNAVGWLLAVVMFGTVLGLPWLSYRFSHSPEADRPQSESSRRFENLLVVGLLGWMTAGVILLGLLFYMILQT